MTKKINHPNDINRLIQLFAILLTTLSSVALATNYHVDFVDGDDTRDGLTPSTAFKHSPGDRAAEANVAATTLNPGDRVLFKGGVTYSGSIAIQTSGDKETPIILDGSAWGEGRAVIHGGDDLTGWTPCTSPEEAKGNPHYSEIFYIDIPSTKSYMDLNLSDSSLALPIAQHPNPSDFYWQDNTENYFTAPTVLKPVGSLTVRPESGTHENQTLPISNLLTGNPAVVAPIPGAGFTYTLETAETIVAVALTVQPLYAALKDVTVLGDGKELLKLKLAKEDPGTAQRFDLPAPAHVQQITFRFNSMHDGEQRNWSKLKQAAAFNTHGENLLRGADSMTFSDPAHLNQADANWYDGMTFALHAGNNTIFRLPIKAYAPATGTLTLPAFGQSQYAQTAYCLFNSVRLIDTPGEYSVESTDDPKISRVYLWPRSVKSGQPENITRSSRAHGIQLNGASHVVVQNFTLLQQNKHALAASGPAENITFINCELSQVRGYSAVNASGINGILIDQLHVHDNPGHTKGIVLHTCSEAVVSHSRLIRNTSTALDYYACTDSRVVDNTVLENLGSHANGLTFYLGCRNILVERNRVAGGNIALTLQEGEGFVFRNNIFDGNHRTTVVGIWPGQPLKDVQFINNTIVRSNSDANYQVGLFSNSRKIEGLVVKNNIIDGLYSDHGVFQSGTFSNNLYTRMAKDNPAGTIGSNERVETDLTKIFVAPEQGDFRLSPQSPAIGSGTNVNIVDDFSGKPRPDGPVDIGAYSRP